MSESLVKCHASKIALKKYLRSSSTTSTAGATEKIGSKLLHPQTDKNLTEVNGDSPFFFR